MSVPTQLFVTAALALALAGCGTSSSRKDAMAPYWRTSKSPAPSFSRLPAETAKDTPANDAVVVERPLFTQTQVSPPPYIAPPPTNSSLALAPRNPAAVSPAETWTPLLRWAGNSGLATVSNLRAGPSPAYALHSTNSTIVIRSGSQVARLDGLDLRLGFSPQVIDGKPYVHTLDLQKTIEPLLESPGALSPLGPGPIIIDAGHGGENVGTRSVLGAHFEKEYTLDWAFRLQTLLAAQGWDVLLTRTGDVDIALSNRVTFADQHRAAAFLSLHFNSSAPDHEQAGLETYYLTPHGMPSTLIRDSSEDASQVFPNNGFDAENLLLAVRIHRELLGVNGHLDRGVRHARFPGVLRNQQRPSVLIEGGYLSNPREARLIADPNYRQKLAEAVAHALGRRSTQTARN